jgi:hypothetical protein
VAWGSARVSSWCSTAHLADGTDHLAAGQHPGMPEAMHDGLLAIAGMRLLELRATCGGRLAYADAQQDHTQAVDRQQHDFAVPFAKPYFETVS